MALEPGHLSEWTETESAIWFSAGRRMAGKTVYEQYLEQQGGHRMTMLTVDDMPDDDEPDEAELEDRWAVRFRK